MKKYFVPVIVFLLLILTAVPSFAISTISFNITDSETMQPWGTADGQSYRIFIFGSSSGQLLDTGVLTTPGNATLDFSCSYGGTCGGATFGTPTSGETVTVYIVLDGTGGDPMTIVRSFSQPTDTTGTFTIDANTGTGPTAVTLSNASVSTTHIINMVFVTVTTLLAIITTMAFYKRRQPAPASFL